MKTRIFKYLMFFTVSSYITCTFAGAYFLDNPAKISRTLFSWALVNLALSVVFAFTYAYSRKKRATA